MRHILFAIALLPCAAQASPLVGGCFVRVYSAGHLAEHPDQRVTAIALKPLAEPHDGVILDLYLRMRGGATVMGTAYCDGMGDGMTCGLEGDAGGFTLGPGKGGILLRVDPGGMSFEGARDWVSISGRSGDDRVFLLQDATARDCRGVAAGS
jgi:hypothetical protein